MSTFIYFSRNIDIIPPKKLFDKCIIILFGERIMPIKDYFGQNLKHLRKERGLTQEQLSEMINLDVRQYSRIETGKGFPSLSTLEKMCSVLKINPACLFDFSSDNEVYNIKSPENALYIQIKAMSKSPSKIKFINTAIKAVNGHKKSIQKLQNILEGMLLISKEH